MPTNRYAARDARAAAAVAPSSRSARRMRVVRSLRGSSVYPSSGYVMGSGGLPPRGGTVSGRPLWGGQLGDDHNGGGRLVGV